jgi:glycosyltransferase involved in cell wall biosynthesis
MTAKKAKYYFQLLARSPKPHQTWVIIPGYNEEKYLGRVLQKVLSQTPRVIVVDDGSRDRTFMIARKYTPYVLRHSVNLGKGAAMRTGCDYAFQELQASAVILLDADDQHDPAELPFFTRQFQKGAAVVLGVRGDLKLMPRSKVIANNFASYAIQALFGTYVPDIPSGYKLLTRQAYPRLRWDSNGYEVELEIAARLARFQIPFVSVCIRTIYHDMNKGMTALDVLHMFHIIVSWKFTL